MSAGKEQIQEEADKINSLDFTKIELELTMNKTLEEVREVSWYTKQEEKILKMLQMDLIHHFRVICNDLQISPLYDESGYVLNLLQFHVPPTLTRVEVNTDMMSNKPLKLTPVKSYHDIFVNNSRTCQNIYISSPAGCGKTSFVKRLALTWCQAHQHKQSENEYFTKEDIDEMRQFKYLFFIFLQESHQCECCIDIMIQTQLLNYLANPHAYSKLEFLQKLLSNEKCLIVMDGLDEWRSRASHNYCRETHPQSRAWPLCTVLTTTRPWKLDVTTLDAGEIDHQLILNDLESELLKMVNDSVIQRMNKLHNKKMKSCDFENELMAKKLNALCKIPAVVMHLLMLWFDGEPLGKSLCDIYCNTIEFLLQRYHMKNRIDVENCDTPAPVFFIDKLHCKVHLHLLSKLGELAFYTIFSDKQESALVFDMVVVKQYMNDKDIEMCWEIGILSQNEVTGRAVHGTSSRKSNVMFLHKSYQEFLAVLYIVLHLERLIELEHKIVCSCNSLEKIFDMSQIFLFMSGLCPHVLSHLCEHLRGIVSSDSHTKGYRSSCKLGPRSHEGEKMRQVQGIMMDCLQESWLNHHKNICLPLSDVFIDDYNARPCCTNGWSPFVMSPSLLKESVCGFAWSDEFNVLVLNNPIHSLSIQNVLSEVSFNTIMKSVIAVNCIQKLWIGSKVPATFVIRLFCEQRHILNVPSKMWSCSELYVTLHKIEGMSADNLCSLFDSFVQLPKSVKVRMENFCVSQGTKDWKKYIYEHSQLTVDDNISGNAYSQHTDNGYDKICVLQFHIDKV